MFICSHHWNQAPQTHLLPLIEFVKHSPALAIRDSNFEIHEFFAFFEPRVWKSIILGHQTDLTSLTALIDACKEARDICLPKVISDCVTYRNRKDLAMSRSEEFSSVLNQKFVE